MMNNKDNPNNYYHAAEIMFFIMFVSFILVVLTGIPWVITGKVFDIFAAIQGSSMMFFLFGSPVIGVLFGRFAGDAPPIKVLKKR
jgi:hypothetical protein